MTNVAEPPTTVHPMSGDEVRGWAWRQTGISSGAKLTLLALANWAGPNAEIYPGQERLATMTNQTSRTIRKHLGDLEDAGLILRERRQRSDGARTSDRYYLNIHVIVDKDLPEDASGRDEPDPEESSDLPEEFSGGLPEDVSGYLPSTSISQEDDEVLSVGPRIRASRLPDDWEPSQELRTWTVGQGLRGANAWRELEKFRDYWVAKPGASGRKLDWDATWRNWVRKALEQHPVLRPLDGHAAFLSSDAQRLQAIARANQGDER